jgi:hypothetical protein
LFVEVGKMVKNLFTNPSALLESQQKTSAESPQPPTNDSERGIIATTALIYTTTRNCVRYAYDEIMYWREIKAVAKRLKEWHEDNKSIGDRIDKTWAKIIDGEDGWYGVLDNLVNITYDIDEYYKQAQKFDQIIAKTEWYYDQFSADKFYFQGDSLTPLFGAILPNTGQSLAFLDKQVRRLPYFDSLSLYSINTKSSDQPYSVQFAVDPDTAQLDIDRLRDALTLIASSTMSTSGAMKNWADVSAASLKEIDKKLKESEKQGILGPEFGASYYQLMNSNATNKSLYQNVAETKLGLTELGYKIFEISATRSQSITDMQHTMIMQNRLDSALSN